jgi:hypothetical protein
MPASRTKCKSASGCAPTGSKPTPITVPLAEPRRELTDFQMIILDLAGDMILNGTNMDDLKELVHAVARHGWHRRWPDTDGFTEDTAYGKSVSEKWPLKLSRHWPEKTEQPSGPPPVTLSDMVRKNLRDNVRRLFNEFMQTARMSDLYLMAEVLQQYEGTGGHWDEDGCESPLAEAFMAQIGEWNRYIKVPRKIMPLVEQYIALLDRAEHPDAA